MSHRTWSAVGAGVLAAAATSVVLVAPAAAAPGELDWYLRDSNAATSTVQALEDYGDDSTYPLVCDGDGTGDFPALWLDGEFLIDDGSDEPRPFAFGRATDVPLCGDWNNDGIDTAGVYRGGVFYAAADNATGTAATKQALGRADDHPIVGDWDGDGFDTVGVVRANRYYLSNVRITNGSVARATTNVVFGLPSDVPLVGDWDGNGTQTLGLGRSGAFFLSNTATAGTAPRTVATSFKFGRASDYPVAGDWWPEPDGATSVGAVRLGTS